jgi:hypothetical protein
VIPESAPGSVTIVALFALAVIVLLGGLLRHIWAKHERRTIKKNWQERERRLAQTMREHLRHPHPDPLPRRGRGSRFDPLAPGGGEGQGEGAHRTRRTRS